MVLLNVLTHGPVRVTFRSLLLSSSTSTCRWSSNVAASQEPTTTSKFSITPQNVTIDGATFQSDDWTNVTPKILSMLERKLHLKQNHPLGLIKARIVDFMYNKYRNHRGNPLFSVFDNLNPGIVFKM